MLFSLLDLLLLICPLFLSLLKLPLRLILLVLLLTPLPVLLDSLAFSLALLLLCSVLFVPVVTFQKLLFSLFEPGDITDQSLFKLVLNHLAVVLLFGVILSFLNCFNLLPDFILFINNLLKLLCV